MTCRTNRNMTVQTLHSNSHVIWLRLSQLEERLWRARIVWLVTTWSCSVQPGIDSSILPALCATSGDHGLACEAGCDTCPSSTRTVLTLQNRNCICIPVLHICILLYVLVYNEWSWGCGSYHCPWHYLGRFPGRCGRHKTSCTSRNVP